MALTAPDWLTRHAGELRPGVGQNVWLVYFDREPQYSLTPVPATGRHACRVLQTINGRRLDSTTVYTSEEDALRGGLEDLRKALGW
jgi:hypothetical protein